MVTGPAIVHCTCFVQILVRVQFLFARDYFEFVAPSMLLQLFNAIRASYSRYAAGSRYV
jgi:hypothetical protein